MPRKRWLRTTLPVIAAVGLLAVACGSSSKSSSAPTTAAATTATTGAAATGAATAAATGTGTGTPGSYSTDLTGVCPADITIQTDWWPEPDHGGLYQLIGTAGKVDISNNSYSGPLGHTGVKLTILAGGPAVGYQTVTSQLYANDSIFLGQVGTDEAIQNSASHPTTAVFASYEKSPQIFFWGNPTWNFKSVADIGKSGAKVLAYDGATYLDVFEGQGLLKKSQVDTSYQGDPSRFVAANGDIVSQGFVTSEPIVYATQVKGWDKPVKYLLVNDEYPVYFNSLVVRSDKLPTESACLKKLVPVIQQAEIDYVHNPTVTNQVIYNFATKLKGGAQLSVAGSAEAVQLMLSQGIVANGTDGVFGSYETARIQKLITTLTPVFQAKHQAVKNGLQVSDIATNEFLDPNIHL